MSNNNLQKAKEDKNDEFYTLYKDIETELQYYQDYLRNKVIYCCADNPSYSNFWKYFKDNYHSLKLKGLISTYLNGICTYYDGTKMRIETLMSNGDFRSEECLKLMTKADIIVTNPPFSLFRDLINILIRLDKQFLLLGGMNNITYKDVFPHLQEKRFRLGVNSGSFSFIVPGQSNKSNLVKKDNVLYAKFGNICWYTNMDHGVRHAPLILTENYDFKQYPEYDNYPARDVNQVKRIPKNYAGPIGVPVTILQKFNYDQFKILGNLGSYGVDGYSLAAAIYVNGKKMFKRILIQRTKEEDFVYRPSKYDMSQSSLKHFSNVFNRCFPPCDVRCVPNATETYDNDGYFINSKDQIIGFDWEIRDRYFSHGIFRFDTLGQYERKIKKSSIQLSIQCDQEQENIIVSWHEDFFNEHQQKVPCITDSIKQSECRVRYTKHFRIYSYRTIFKFKAMLLNAFLIGYNHKAWTDC